MKKTPVRLQMNSYARKSNDAHDILMGLLFIEFKQQTKMNIQQKSAPLTLNTIHILTKSISVCK